MPDGGLVLGVPPALLKLQQQNLLERAFHDGLFPNMLFRGEAEVDEWPDHASTMMTFTRPGLMAPVTTPLIAGVDPEPQQLTFEQWTAFLYRYGNSIDTHTPTSVTANADLFLRNIHQLGLNAAQSLNRITRNNIYTPYLSGSTNMIASGSSGDSAIRVASVNGFTDVVNTSTTIAPVAVSAATPLPITIKNSGGDILVNVIGYDLDNPNDPTSPGTLILDQTLGTSVASRTPVLSSQRPVIARAGGGNSVDAIGVSDVVQLQDFINLVNNQMRKFNVFPHEDGFYNCHIPPEAVAQLFTDQVVQRLNTARPDDVYYQQAFIGTMANVRFMINQECPDVGNSGPLTSTGTSSIYAQDIGAEVVNNAGIRIGRAIVTGVGALQERWLDEKKYVTEAGVTGKIGDFTIVNQGISIETLRTQLILRAPINRTMDKVAATWTATTSFATPSDISANGPATFQEGRCP